MSLVSGHFSRAARTYDQGAGLHRHVAARLVGLMPDPERVGTGRLLEVGCGTGVLSERLLQRFPGASLCLLDAAPAMIDCVQDRWRNRPGFETVVADIEEYRAPRPFDWVFSSSALHWIDPLSLAFDAIKANLEKGGGLVAALMVEGTLGELQALRRRVAPGKTPVRRLPKVDVVLAALSAAGFVVNSSEVEAIQARYHSADDFLRTLHAQGLTGGPVSRAALPLSRLELKRLRHDYDIAFRDGSGGVYATFMVHYVSATCMDSGSAGSRSGEGYG